jgi:hypothetical protein
MMDKGSAPRLSIAGIGIGLLLAMGIRLLVQGVKEPAGAIVINIVNFLISHGFADRILITRHDVYWLLPSTYVVTGSIAISLALCLAFRINATKSKPLPKQGLANPR